MTNHKENSEHQPQPDVTFPKFLSAGPPLVRGSTIIKSTPCICVLTVFVFLFFFGGGCYCLKGWFGPGGTIPYGACQQFRSDSERRFNLDVLVKLIKRDKNG